MNLYRRAAINLDGFTNALLGARAATKRHSASIRKQNDANGTLTGPTKNRMAYFFVLLEDVLGLAELGIAGEVGGG